MCLVTRPRNKQNILFFAFLEYKWFEPSEVYSNRANLCRYF